jgi:hypothetical protein
MSSFAAGCVALNKSRRNDGRARPCVSALGFDLSRKEAILHRIKSGDQPYPSVSFPPSVLIASSTLWKM